MQVTSGTHAVHSGVAVAANPTRLTEELAGSLNNAESVVHNHTASENRSLTFEATDLERDPRTQDPAVDKTEGFNSQLARMGPIVADSPEMRRLAKPLNAAPTT